MLAMLPVLISSTLLVSLVALDAGSPGNPEHVRIYQFNMAMAHQRGFEIARRRGFTAGPVAAPATWPFAAIDDWQGELIVAGGQMVQLTWPTGGRSPPGAGRGLAEMIPVLDALADETGRELEHFGGEFFEAEDGGGSVGPVAIPAPSIRIATGTPVFGTWIQ